MSAFQCNDATLHTIVLAWAHLPPHRRFRWPMSAAAAEHYAAKPDKFAPPLCAGRDGFPLADATCSAHLDLVAWDLARENALSVGHRYHEAPEFVGVAPVRVTGQVPDRWTAIKCADCLEYQSCEHEGWETSAAKQGLDRLLHILLRLPAEYEAAPWGL